jgi:hypothetical protein
MENPMNALKIAACSVLALATAAPASAQYRETPASAQAQRDYQYQRQQYDQSRQNYEAQRDSYEASRDSYRESRADYRAARSEYERRLADWETARIRYDARYGYGAYARRYARPSWDEAYWVNRYPAPSAGSYGYNASANVRCDSNNSTVAAGAIGAILGGILGSNIAGHGDRTEGAVLGAVVGGGLGAAVGNANDKYKCDSRGPYFAYSETVPYRESRSWRYGSNNSSYYTRQRCRLAPAPIDSYGRDYRYVRVCPDASGRYRITG